MQRKVSTTLAKEVEHYVRSKGLWLLHPDKEVDTSDLEKVVQAVTLWTLVMIDTIGFENLSARVWKTWVCNLAEASLVQANDFFKAVDDILLHSISFGDFSSRIRSLPVYKCSMKALLAPILPCIRDHFADYACYSHRKRMGVRCRKIRSFLLFVSHLTVKDERSIDKSYQKYYDNLTRLSGVTSRPTQFMKDWVASIQLPTPFGNFLGCHGNGAVAEQRTVRGRLVGLTEYDKFRILNTRLVQRVSRLCKVEPPWWPETPKPLRVTRLAAVPKGLGEWRIIGMEPTDKQFIQHHFFRSCDFRLSKLSKHCDLSDQSRNRAAALLGSIPSGSSGFSHYSCIDLSSASDSVRAAFVFELFERRPDWAAAFALARTRFTLRPNGDLVANYHYAGMGSACTFVAECIVFAAIIEEAYHRLGLDSLYWVYGDDLIVDSRAYDLVCELLEEFGFVVNHTKSYGPDDPYFREACGGHFLFGEPVDPVRLGRRFNLLSDADYLTKLLDLCNRSIGLFPLVRQYGLNLLLARYGDGVPFTHQVTDTSGLYTTTDLYSVPVSYDEDLQRSFASVLHVKQRLARNPFERKPERKYYACDWRPVPFTSRVCTLKLIEADYQCLNYGGDFGLYKWFLEKEQLRGHSGLQPLAEQRSIAFQESWMETCTTRIPFDNMDSYTVPSTGYVTGIDPSINGHHGAVIKSKIPNQLSSFDELILTEVLNDTSYSWERDTFL